MKAVIAARQLEIATDIRVADSFFTRLRGLLGRRSLRPGEGLLIQPCKGVHTVGMLFPIDVLFLDEAGRIIASMRQLPPFRFSGICFEAQSALELPAGTLDRFAITSGEQVSIVNDYATP